MIKAISYFLTFIMMCLFSFPLIVKAENLLNETELHSKAAIVLDAESGIVLYEKNSTEKLPPASITKIATAIYAIEKGKLDEIVIVSENARNVDGTKVYLEAGEEVQLIKLVQGLLINSGNDAGVAIAEHLSGSVDSFVEDLNTYLQEEIGVTQTHFTNPHGLYEPLHMTTALDMAKITQYAMKNEIFREIFQTQKLPWDGETWDTTLINHHLLVRDHSYEGITGGKNGYVKESGFTLVTTAERSHLSLIVVSLNSRYDYQAYEDTVELLDYGFQNYESERLASNQIFEDAWGKKYTLNTEAIYTKKAEESVELMIQSDGELLVKGEDSRTILSKPLTELEIKEKNEQIKTEVVENPKEEEKINVKKHLLIIVPLSLAITLFMIGCFIMQVRKL